VALTLVVDTTIGVIDEIPPKALSDDKDDVSPSDS